jgi:hypothetical protein
MGGDEASPGSPSPDSRWPLTSRARAGFGPFDEGRGAADESPAQRDECSGGMRTLKLGVPERMKGGAHFQLPPTDLQALLMQDVEGPNAELGRLQIVFASRG